MGMTSTSNTVPQMPNWVWDYMQGNAKNIMDWTGSPYQPYTGTRFVTLEDYPQFNAAMDQLNPSKQEAAANQSFLNQYQQYAKNLGGDINSALNQGQNRFIDPGLKNMNRGATMVENAVKYLNQGDNYLTKAGNVTQKGVGAANQAGQTFDRAQNVANQGVQTIKGASENFDQANALFGQGASTIGQASPLFSQAAGLAGQGASTLASASPLYQQAVSLMNKGEATTDLANPYYAQSSGLLEQANRLSPEVQSQIATGNQYIGQGMDTTGLAKGANAVAANLLTGPGTSAQSLYELAAKGQLMPGAMNPYINDVVNSTATLANRNFQQNVLPSLQRSFVGGGGFGSTRNMAMDAQAAANMQQDLTNTQANLLQSGWNNQMQNMLTSAGGLSQAAGQMTDVGSLYNAIANSQIGAGQGMYQGAGATQGLMSQLGDLASGYNNLIGSRIAQGAEYGNLGTQVQGVGDSTVNQGLGYGQLANVMSGIGNDIVNQGLGYGQLGQGQTQLGNAVVNQGLGLEQASDTITNIGMGRLQQANTYGNLGNDFTNIANSFGQYAQTKGNLGSTLADIGSNRIQLANTPLSLQNEATQGWNQALQNLQGMQDQRLTQQQANAQAAWNNIAWGQQQNDYNYNQFLEARDWDRNMLSWINGLINPIASQTSGQKTSTSDGGATAIGLGTSAAAIIAALAL